MDPDDSGDDAAALRARVDALEQTVADQQATIEALSSPTASRRGVLAALTGVAGAGALGAYSQRGAAQAAGQVGTSSEPVDVEAWGLNVQDQLAGDLDAGGNDLTNVGAVSVGESYSNRNWNDAIVAVPGERTVQQALDAATDHDLVVVRGVHEESSINIPHKALTVLFWGDAKIKNTAIDGSHTLILPDVSQPLMQHWKNPRIEGNSSCGDGIHAPEISGVQSDGRNQPNSLALINPQIWNHGGYAVNWWYPLRTEIRGWLDAADQDEILNFRNNGQNKTTSANLRWQYGNHVQVTGCTFAEAERSIWATNHNQGVIQRIIDNNEGYGLYLEGCLRMTLGPMWFEGTTTADIKWIESAGNSASTMMGKESVQYGAIKWNEGVSFGSSFEGRAIIWGSPNVQNKTDDELQTYIAAIIPEVSGDMYSMNSETVEYVDTSTTDPTLKARDSTGNIVNIGTF